jgi:hypothetical protein
MGEHVVPHRDPVIPSLWLGVAGQLLGDGCYRQGRPMGRSLFFDIMDNLYSIIYTKKGIYIYIYMCMYKYIFIYTYIYVCIISV